MSKKVAFCVPTYTKPYDVTLKAIEASCPLFDEAGWEHSIVFEVGCPYVSAARSKLLRKAMDAKADVVVFIDHDLSWEPRDLLRLVESPEHVTAGTYRFKRDPVEFMGYPFRGVGGGIIVNDDVVGETPRIKMHSIPAGFLKITKEAVNVFMTHYPELTYGDRFNPMTDLFNHGAINNVWYGEDYAFSKRWNEKCGDIWLIPDLNITHWLGDVPFAGNYHDHLIESAKKRAELKVIEGSAA